MTLTENARKLDDMADRAAFAADDLWRIVMNIPLSPEGQDLALDLASQICGFVGLLDQIRDLPKHEV